jgi:hypothetical protein
MANGPRPKTLAEHLDCSRAYIGKLEAEGVIQRHGGGFPLHQSHVCLNCAICGASGGNLGAVQRLMPSTVDSVMAKS